jgi:2-haloacid dehalogenase
MNQIKALTFDTGGTILDWHTGFKEAFRIIGERHDYNKDWELLANELRRKSLKAMLNLGEKELPKYNFDDAHKFILLELINEHNLGKFTEADINYIAYEAPHKFKCWEDFPPILPKLRAKFMVCSFTILSYRIIIDTARNNGLSWDAVFSCEGIKKYKLLPEAYKSVSQNLQLEPEQCLMVACHNFDLDAAKRVGFKTAFVRRPNEWGEEGPPDPIPNPNHDIIVDNFPHLLKKLEEDFL